MFPQPQLDAYVRDLGNTPGHLNHWTKTSFVRFISQSSHRQRSHQPLPLDHHLGHPPAGS
jgi:hypothetical protein